MDVGWDWRRGLQSGPSPACGGRWRALARRKGAAACAGAWGTPLHHADAWSPSPVNGRGVPTARPRVEPADDGGIGDGGGEIAWGTPGCRCRIGGRFGVTSDSAARAGGIIEARSEFLT